jgi:hypothetical protein
VPSQQQATLASPAASAPSSGADEDEEEQGPAGGDAPEGPSSTDILELLKYESVRFWQLVLLQDQLGRVLGVDRSKLDLPDSAFITLRQLQIEVEKLIQLFGTFCEKLELQDIDLLVLYDATFSVDPSDRVQLQRDTDQLASSLGE